MERRLDELDERKEDEAASEADMSVPPRSEATIGWEPYVAARIEGDRMFAARVGKPSREGETTSVTRGPGIREDEPGPRALTHPTTGRGEKFSGGGHAATRLIASYSGAGRALDLPSATDLLHGPRPQRRGPRYRTRTSNGAGT